MADRAHTHYMTNSTRTIPLRNDDSVTITAVSTAYDGKAQEGSHKMSTTYTTSHTAMTECALRYNYSIRSLFISDESIPGAMRRRPGDRYIYAGSDYLATLTADGLLTDWR